MHSSVSERITDVEGFALDAVYQAVPSDIHRKILAVQVVVNDTIFNIRESIFWQVGNTID